MKFRLAIPHNPVGRLPFTPFAIPALSLAAALTSPAAVLVTNVVDSGSWQSGTTWSSGSKPTTGDVVRIGDIAGGGLPSLTLSASESVLSLSATAATTLTGLGGLRTVTVGGGSSRFDQSLTLDSVRLETQLVAGSPAPEIRFEDGLSLANGAGIAAGTLGSTGQLRFSGLAAQSVTSSDSSGWITIGANGSLMKQGTSTLTIGSGVKFQSSGTLSISGTLELTGTGAQSSELQGGAVGFLATNSSLKNTGTANITGSFFVAYSIQTGFGRLDNLGTLTKSGVGTVFNANVPVNNSGTFRLSSGKVAFGSGGAYTQTGASSRFDFAGGTLELNNKQTMLFNGGEMVGSASAAQFTGALSAAQFNAGSALKPGPAGGGVGSIAFPEALNLAGASLWVDIASLGSYDQVSAKAVTLSSSPALNVNNTGGTYPINSLFTIINGTSLSGTFAGLPNNATLNSGGQMFRINYLGGSGDVTLTAVPETQYYAGAAALALLGFAAWRRQQKSA